MCIPPLSALRQETILLESAARYRKQKDKGGETGALQKAGFTSSGARASVLMMACTSGKTRRSSMEGPDGKARRALQLALHQLNQSWH